MISSATQAEGGANNHRKQQRQPVRIEQTSLLQPAGCLSARKGASGAVTGARAKPRAVLILTRSVAPSERMFAAPAGWSDLDGNVVDYYA